MIEPRPLYLVAALLAGVGAVLRVAPVAVADSASAAPAAPSAAAPEPSTAGTDTARYRAIVAANPFSSDRLPPKVRFVPEGLRRDTVPVARAPSRPREPSLRLFGITRGPGGAVALIDADPAVPGAEVYKVGDAVRDGRLVSIGDSTVTVSRPSGRVVLRLPDAGEPQ